MRSTLFPSVPKVTYPNYSKHWPYLLAATMNWGCIKILYYGSFHGLFFFTFQFFWVKIHSELNWKLRIEFYKAICQKPAHAYLPKWLSSEVSFKFQVFIVVLGMYNSVRPSTVAGATKRLMNPQLLFRARWHERNFWKRR